jgi:O-antigen/teichoic acid export membrane protein
MKIITNAFWLSLCRISTDILSFVLFAVISRAFGPSGTGEYSYAFAIATLVALTSTAGFEDYGIRQYARADEHDRRNCGRIFFRHNAFSCFWACRRSSSYCWQACCTRAAGLSSSSCQST